MAQNKKHTDSAKAKPYKNKASLSKAIASSLYADRNGMGLRYKYAASPLPRTVLAVNPFVYTAPSRDHMGLDYSTGGTLHLSNSSIQGVSPYIDVNANHVAPYGEDSSDTYKYTVGAKLGLGSLSADTKASISNEGKLTGANIDAKYKANDAELSALANISNEGKLTGAGVGAKYKNVALAANANLSPTGDISNGSVNAKVGLADGLNLDVAAARDFINKTNKYKANLNYHF